MKLKYYLRGMGMGIVVTTIILAISFSHREVEISDEEIMARAATLGMVMSRQNAEEEDAYGQDINADTEENTPGADVNTDTEEDVPESDINMGTEQAADTEIDLQDEESQENESELNNSAQTETYRLVINKGDVCRVVCETLAENGVIDDAESLRTYLFQLGYANSINIGAYDIPYGLTMEEVAQIIMAGPLE